MFQRIRGPRQFWIDVYRLLARRSLAGGARIADQFACGLWTYLLTQFFADHAHWGGVTTGQALDKFYAVSSVRADCDRTVRFFAIFRLPDSEACAQIFHHFQSTRHRATECAADPDVRFPGRTFAKHWIKSDHLENVDRLEAEFFRDPEDGFVADESEVFLPQMQEGQRCAAALLAGIMRNRPVHSLLQFGGNLDGRLGCH